MSDVSDTAGLSAGDMLGVYRLEAPLETAEGQDGTVRWTATDTKLDRAVVVQSVSGELTGDPGFVEAFRRECRQLAKLAPRCPHVIPVVDFLEEPSGLFVVHDYPPGRRLPEFAGPDGSALTDTNRFQVLVQLLMGLGELHAAGMAHGDLTPQRLWIEDEPAPDGGLSLRLSDVVLGQSGGLEMPLAMASVAYASPERISGGAANNDSDLYAAGMIGYELFAAETFAEAFADVIGDGRNAHLRWMNWHTNTRANPPQLTDLRPGVEELIWIAPVLARLMARDPAQRYKSASEALADLKSAAEAATNSGGAKPSAGAAKPVAQPAVKPAAGAAKVAAKPAARSGVIAKAVPAKPVTAAPAMAAGLSPKSAVAKPGAITPAKGDGGSKNPLKVASTAIAVTAPPKVPALGAASSRAMVPGFAAPPAVPPPPVVGALAVPSGPAGTSAVGASSVDEDTRQLPPVKKPVYLSPLFLGGMVLVLLVGGLGILAKLRNSGIKTLEEAAIKAWRDKDYTLSSEKHRALAEALRQRDANNPQVNVTVAIADLCEALALADKDPVRAAKMGVELRQRFADLNIQNKAFVQRAEELALKGSPVEEFSEQLKLFATAVETSNTGGLIRHLERMGELNRQAPIGKNAVVANCAELRRCLDETDKRHRQILDLARRIEGGERGNENRRELEEIKNALEGNINNMNLMMSLPNLAPELRAVEAAVRRQVELSEKDRQHAVNLLGFYKELGVSEERLAAARSQITKPDPKRPAPDLLLSQARRALEQAEGFANAITTAGRGGIPAVSLAKIRADKQFCDDATLFLTKYQPQLQKISRPGQPPVVGFVADKLADEELKSYLRDFARLRDNGNLELITGAPVMYNAVLSEIEKRDGVASEAMRQRQYDELETQARDAAAQGDFPKEIELREAQAKLRALPAALTERVNQLRRALVLVPMLEAQGQALKAVLVEGSDVLKSGSLVKPAPGKGTELAVDGVLSKFDAVKQAAMQNLADAKALAVFGSEASLREKLTPVLRDAETVDRMAVTLSALRGEMIRFDNLLRDIEAQKRSTARTQMARDADTQIRQIREAAVEPTVEPLRREIVTAMEKLLDYTKSCTNLDLLLADLEGARRAADGATTPQDRDMWVGRMAQAESKIKEIERKLPFPLDDARRERITKAKQMTDR